MPGKIVILIFALLLGAIAPAVAQDGTIGFRLMVQPWDPVTDDDAVLIPLDQPTVISDLVSTAWNTFVPILHNSLVSSLSSPDYLASGVTFSNIDLRLPKPTFKLSYVSGGGSSPLDLKATATVQGVSIELTSTTPTILGRDFDPRCSARTDIAASFHLIIGSDSSSLIHAQFDDREKGVQLSNFSFDSQNFPCDVIKEIVGLFKAESLIVKLVESPSVERPLSIALAREVDKAVSELNQQIAALIPPGVSLRGSWLNNRVVGGQMLAIFLGEPSPQADQSPRATITGRLRVNSEVAAQGFDCIHLPIKVARKAGPRPMTNPFGKLGDEAPYESLSTKVTCDPVSADGSQVYHLAGLSSGFRNHFTFMGHAAPCKAGEAWKTGVWLAPPDNSWPAAGILPSMLDGAFDLNATLMDAPCAQLFVDTRPIEEQAEELIGDLRGDGPRPNELANLIQSGALTVDQSLVLGSILANQGLLNALNPQPLPPAEMVDNLTRQIALQGEVIRLQQQQLAQSRLMSNR